MRMSLEHGVPTTAALALPAALTAAAVPARRGRDLRGGRDPCLQAGHRRQASAPAICTRCRRTIDAVAPASRSATASASSRWTSWSASVTVGTDGEALTLIEHRTDAGPRWAAGRARSVLAASLDAVLRAAADLEP